MITNEILILKCMRTILMALTALGVDEDHYFDKDDVTAPCISTLVDQVDNVIIKSNQPKEEDEQ